MARKTPRQHAAEFVNSCTPWQLLYPQRRKGSGGGQGKLGGAAAGAQWGLDAREPQLSQGSAWR